MRRATTAIFVLFAIAVYAGCATLFTGSHDDVRFESEPEGAKVVIDGTDQGRTPTTVSVKRPGFGDREVVMEMDGYEERRFTLEKQFNWVSILNGTGILGWGIDIGSGAITKYNPQQYTVELEPEDQSTDREEQEGVGQERGEELPMPASPEETSESERPQDESQPSEELPSNVERPGDGGDDVAWVQSTLNELGYDCGIADGDMGANTRSCIRAFQQENGLQATGAINEETYERMLEASPAYDLQKESQQEETRGQPESERRVEEKPEPQPQSRSGEREGEAEDQENTVQETSAGTQESSSTQAQAYPIDRGSLIVGGSINLTSQGGDLYGGSDRVTTSQFNPVAQYFIIPGLAVGGEVSVSSTSRGDDTVTSVGIGPTATYFFGDPGSDVYPFVSGGVGFSNVASGGDSASGFEIRFSGGVAYMLARNVALTGEAFMTLENRSSGSTSRSGNALGFRVGITAFIF